MNETLHTIEVDRWSEPDEMHEVKHLGMIKADDAFNQLYTHLQAKDMLPDEYFEFSYGSYVDAEDELPEYIHAVCQTDFGESEGIYLDILLEIENGQQIRFAAGKMLSNDADAFFRMSRIAAECTLMLNGRGKTFTKHNVEAVFTPEESLTLGKVLEKMLCEYNEPEEKVMLNRLLEKVFPFDDRYGTQENYSEIEW